MIQKRQKIKNQKTKILQNESSQSILVKLKNFSRPDEPNKAQKGSKGF